MLFRLSRVSFTWFSILKIGVIVGLALFASLTVINLVWAADDLYLRGMPFEFKILDGDGVRKVDGDKPCPSGFEPFKKGRWFDSVDDPSFPDMPERFCFYDIVDPHHILDGVLGGSCQICRKISCEVKEFSHEL